MSTFDVNVEETILVQPSKPPFHESHTLALSHLDNDRNLNLTFRYLRLYANDLNPSNSDNPSTVIATALSSALVQYYSLAARLCDLQGRLVLHCVKENLALPFVSATANCTLESVNYLDGVNPEDFVERLVPDPGQCDMLAHPCWLQVTVFECGGFSLGAAIHHAMNDGLGGSQFFNAVAELARGTNMVSINPVWDRKGLLGPRDPPRVEGVVKEFLGLEKGVEVYNVVGKVVRECFEVKDEWVERLKNGLVEKCGSKFTTFEALGAFIWRAKVKAGRVPGEEKVKFAYSINIRKIINPPLPQGYWGNACVPMYAQLKADDLIKQPLHKTAELIRASKLNATDEYVRSYIDMQELHYDDGITAGKRVSGFTDWRHLGHSSVDFGWGGPVNVLPLSKKLLGSVEPCYFLPSCGKNGVVDGFKVLVTLIDSALPAFMEEMNKLSSIEIYEIQKGNTDTLETQPNMIKISIK